MTAVNAAFNVVTLAFALAAIFISAMSIRRQSADVRRSNLLLFMVEIGARRWNTSFREARDYILSDLSQYDPGLGVSGLPRPARDYVYEVGGFYQDLGALVTAGVIEEDLAIALHYTGIKDAWRALAPYVQAERVRLRERGAGGLFGSFEHLAVYVESVPGEKVIGDLAVKYRRRRFPSPDAAPAGTAMPGDHPGAAGSMSPAAGEPAAREATSPGS
jgi:hypothetical protein